MDTEELKKKIEDILEEYNFETDDGEGWILDTEEMADDLIAAGIGDIEESKFQAYQECYEWLKENLYWDEEGITKRFYERFLEKEGNDG